MEATKTTTAFATSSSSAFTGTSVTSTRTPSICHRTPKPSPVTLPRAVLGSRTSFNVEVTKKYKVTVQQKRGDVIVEVDGDTDLREALLAKGVDVYTFGGKLRNCGGGGQCGTCLISVEEGGYYAGVRTPREEFLLADKPESWRLACRTKVTGDVTIRTKPQA